MPLFTPDATLPPSLYYSAGEAHHLATLAVDTIDHIVSDLRINSSEREHYVTGWMGAHSVVIIHHYQDKRGTANGLVLTKEGELRLSVQSITFRIPKFYCGCRCAAGRVLWPLLPMANWASGKARWCNIPS